MPTSKIEWGWRMKCCEPGCTQHLERWDEEGLPPLWSCYAEDAGDEGGWFARRERRPSGSPTRYARYAYCPQHASPAFRWLKLHLEWTSARREAGRTTKGFLARAIEIVTNKMIGKELRTWENENPRPIPPWEHV